MKNAFIGLDLSTRQNEQVTEYLKSYDSDVEVSAFDTPWDAISYLRGEGKAYVTNKGDHHEGVIALGNTGVETQIVYADLPGDEFNDESVIEAWLKGLDPVQAENERLEQENEKERASKVEDVLGHDSPIEESGSNPMNSLADDWLTEPPESEDHDQVERINEEQLAQMRQGNIEIPDKPRDSPSLGLNSKVQIDSEALQKKNQYELRRKKSQERHRYEPSDRGYCCGITGPFGGGGKTTFGYFASQVMAMAQETTSNRTSKVILIESDFKTPKLQNRLNIPRGQDLSRFAKFLEDVRNGDVQEDRKKDLAQKVLEDICFHDDASGAEVIACPYDDSSVNPALLREALQKAVVWAQRVMGYFVILDLDSIGSAEGVELDLVQMCNTIIIVTNTRAMEVQKSRLPWKKDIVEIGNGKDRSHIDDTKNLIRKLTRPVRENGFDVPEQRIKVVFNETTARELDKRIISTNEIDTRMIAGNIEYIKEIDRTWAGDIAFNRERARDTAKVVTEIMHRATSDRDVGELLKSIRAA